MRREHTARSQRRGSLATRGLRGCCCGPPDVRSRRPHHVGHTASPPPEAPSSTRDVAGAGRAAVLTHGWRSTVTHSARSARLAARVHPSCALHVGRRPGGGGAAVAVSAQRCAGAEGRGLSLRAHTLALGGWLFPSVVWWATSMSALADMTHGGGDGWCCARRQAKRWLGEVRGR